MTNHEHTIAVVEPSLDGDTTLQYTKDVVDLLNKLKTKQGSKRERRLNCPINYDAPS